jgi:hypothetical protein
MVLSAITENDVSPKSIRGVPTHGRRIRGNSQASAPPRHPLGLRPSLYVFLSSSFRSVAPNSQCSLQGICRVIQGASRCSHRIGDRLGMSLEMSDAPTEVITELGLFPPHSRPPVDRSRLVAALDDRAKEHQPHPVILPSPGTKSRRGGLRVHSQRARRSAMSSDASGEGISRST